MTRFERRIAAWPRCSFETVDHNIFLDDVEFEKSIETRWILGGLWRAGPERRMAAWPRGSFEKVGHAIFLDCIEFEKSIEARWILRAGG